MKMKAVFACVAACVAGAVLAGTYLPGEGGVSVRVWQTSGRHPFREVPNTPFSPHLYTDAAPLAVDAAKVVAPYLGIGVSMTDASAWLLSQLAPERRRAFLEHVFTPQGANLTALRLNIGASDYSTALYTYNDTPNDVEMRNFSVVRDDRWLFPMVREALALQPEMFLYASPWSPPGWMKDSGSFLDGNFKDGMEVALANYLVAYAKACRDRGLKLAAMTIQNEAGLSVKGAYPSCVMTGAQEARIARALNPRLRAAGLDTKVWIWDWHYKAVTNRILAQLADAATRAAVGGVAFHSYTPRPECLKDLRAAHPDLPLYHTEHGPALSDPSRTEAWWCRTIFGAMTNGCSLFTGWNLALTDDGQPLTGPHTCGGLLNLDVERGEWTESALFRVFRHIGPFVKRGARILQLPGFTDGAAVILFRNPNGEYVLVVGHDGMRPKGALPRPRLRVRFGGQDLALPLPFGTWSLTTLVFGN